MFIHTVLFSYSDKYRTKICSRLHRETNFQMSWLEDNRFKSWLKPGKLPSQAIWTLCNNALISVDKMGVSALSSHAQGKKHKEKEKQQSPLSCLFFYQAVAS